MPGPATIAENIVRLVEFLYYSCYPIVSMIVIENWYTGFQTSLGPSITGDIPRDDLGVCRVSRFP
jgi:hypothetical protein